MKNYDDFIKRKATEDVESGFEPSQLGDHLFDFQASIVEWACKRGRAAIFADTGLGKTAMQTEWARQVSEHTGGRVLIATNWQKQNYLRGEQVKLAKLTADAVEEIRSAQKQRDHLRMHIRTLSNKALAARHKVSVSAVEAVLSGRTWMHIT